MSASASPRARKAPRNIPATAALSIPAKTLIMLPLIIGFYDPTGVLIDTKTAIDPRECYCNDYNAFSDELGTGIVARPIL